MKESTSGHDLTIDLVLDVFLGQLLYKNMRFWYTPTKFTSSPLKIDGWETTFLLGPGPFSGGMFNFRRVMWYASPWRLCATWLQGPEGVWHPRPSAETLVGKVQILKRSYFYREQITFEGLQTQQILFTSRAARGGGGSFKNRKRIGKIRCCESQLSERKHSPIVQRSNSLTISELVS